MTPFIGLLVILGFAGIIVFALEILTSEDAPEQRDEHEDF